MGSPIQVGLYNKVNKKTFWHKMTNRANARSHNHFFVFILNRQFVLFLDIPRVTQLIR